MNPDDLLAIIRATQARVADGNPLLNVRRPSSLSPAKLAKIRNGIEAARGDKYTDAEIDEYLAKEYGVRLAEVDAPAFPQITASKRKELQTWVAENRRKGVPDEQINQAIGAKYGASLTDVMSPQSPSAPRGARGLPAFAPADALRGAGSELSTEKLTLARNEVKIARSKGYPDSDIDEYLREEYGKTLSHVMAPTSGDYARAGISGVTFGHNDELAGLLTKIAPGGAGYAETRDRVRANDAAARYAAPKRMLAAEVAGGMLPSLLTFGATAPVPATAAGRALAAGKVGAGVGAVSGLGHSEATDVSGMAKDVTVGGVGGAAVGVGLSGLASLIRGVDALRPTNIVAREAGAVLPDDAFLSVAGQEALAPGTSVLADRSDEMLLFAKALGQDPKAASTAARQAAHNVRAIEKVRDMLVDAGRGVDDPDVAFLTERLTAARGLEQTIKQSAAQHAAARAAGLQSVSLDALTLRRPGLMDVLGKILAPNRARRARLVQQLLVSPQNTQRAMAMMAPSEPAFPLLGRGLLYGGSEALGPSLAGVR